MTGEKAWRAFGKHCGATILAARRRRPAGVLSEPRRDARFFDKNSLAYVGGMLEICNDRLFPFWRDLEAALKTGQPQNLRSEHSRKPMFEELYSDLPRLEQFMGAMTGISRANFVALAEKVDFSRYQTLCDVGGATGLRSILVAERHSHLR